MARPTPGAGAATTLLTPVEQVKGVTPERAEALRRLGIPTVAHLVYHLPMRHEALEAEAPISAVVPGRIISARGEVTATRVMNRGRRPRFEAVLMDPTGRLDLVWFHQTFLNQRIHPGMRLRVQGKAARKGNLLQVVNPRYEVLHDGAGEPEARAARLRPVYPASEEMPSWAIERAIAAVLDAALPLIEDHLTEAFCAERQMPTLREAYRMMHSPAHEEEIKAGRRRLVYDELLLLQLGVFMRRHDLAKRFAAPALRWSRAIDEHIRARLPFAMTPAQEEVVTEVVADLQRTIPTNRLVQGDVGAGKTVIALYAMLVAVASRHQAALLAPTELLAEQHFASIGALLAGSSVRMALLTGSLGPEERASLQGKIAAGEVDLVVGTHSLLTEAVNFRSLGVAVIDEQHRFGVHQRARLREQPSNPQSRPHVLVLTATPIPRTLAMTGFGDLDVSQLKGLPPGRSPVRTLLADRDASPEVYTRLRERLDAGEQGYVVVPAIESESDDLLTEADAGEKRGLRSVSTVVRELETGPLAGKRLAAIHGRLKPETRQALMERFRAGAIDVLVATSVIEVGVDVPNATVMVIEQAERFGLAQLHQLRGRVGRGTKPSVCLLITDLGPEAPPEPLARLHALVSTTDGFALAERDLELRGPGELIGSKQSGSMPLRLAEFPRDTDLLLMARRDAAAWIERSPRLAESGEAVLRRRLLKAHGEQLDLVDIA